jgi:DNA-binding CsgD family transcriptional regulator
VVNPGNGGQTAPESPSSEIESALRSLASKLQGLLDERRHQGTDGSCGDNVLIDVEFGDVRLLVLRRGRPSPMSLLSPREREIARMVAQGYANKTIASVLDISSWTVASHLRRIFVKLQVSSRAAMAMCLLGTDFNEFSTTLGTVMSDDLVTGPRPSQIETHTDPVTSGHLPVRVRL